MDALSYIENAGFDVAMVDGFIEISPASALTMQQREFLKSHKAEIINELKKRQSVIKPPLIKCRDCLNFEFFNVHGEGAGTCNAGVQSSGAAWWSESLHECAKFDAKIEHVELQPIPANTLTVICYTPAGKPLEVEARDEAHAEFLRKMNPKPTKGTPRDESD